MFKVRATLVNFLGDVEKYPCHFQHRLGDEVIFDGERYTGRLCPDLWTLLIPKANSLWEAGPRFTPSDYYMPLWYPALSKEDPSKKAADGLGFANILKTVKEPKYHMANLQPPNAWIWPPYPEHVSKDITIVCHDTRTAVVFKLEAFDLCDKGLSIPYFRREMVILKKVLGKPGIPVEKILDEFSREEIEEIYPALSPQIMVPLVEELEAMNYLKIDSGKAYVTESGEKKLNDFIAGLSEAEKKAMYL